MDELKPIQALLLMRSFHQLVSRLRQGRQILLHSWGVLSELELSLLLLPESFESIVTALSVATN